MNILIVKLSAIGDVVHTLPSLAALRKLYPDAHITWVIEEAALDIIKDNPYLDKIIISRRKQWIHSLIKRKHVIKTIKEIRSFIKVLRDRRYDIVIDFMGLFKSSLIVLLSGGKRKLGYDSMQELSGFFLNEKIYEDMNKHAVDRYLDFLLYLGADVEKPKFLILIKKEDEENVENLLRSNDICVKEQFIVVSPTSFAGQTRLWENDKFAMLCDKISSCLNIKIIFTGDKKNGRIEDIQSMMTSPSVNLGGQTNLKELAYLCKLSVLIISPDSGPMHVAAAMGTPVIALFGPSDPKRTGPYGERHTVIRKNLPCSPCFLKKCETRACMRGISVDTVFGAIQEQLVGKGDTFD